jgi:hypothetical protein
VAKCLPSMSLTVLNKQGKLTKHHAMKTFRWVEVYPHEFLTSELVGGE